MQNAYVHSTALMHAIPWIERNQSVSASASESRLQVSNYSIYSYIRVQFDEWTLSSMFIAGISTNRRLDEKDKIQMILLAAREEGFVALVPGSAIMLLVREYLCKDINNWLKKNASCVNENCIQINTSWKIHFIDKQNRPELQFHAAIKYYQQYLSMNLEIYSLHPSRIRASLFYW